MSEESTKLNLQKSERPHIAFFGCRNAGKSSVVNAFTNQNLSVVSEYKGTTTDPVLKSMELLPLGPVVIIDTAGIDDSGELGNLRIEKTKQVLDKTDIAVLVVDINLGINSEDQNLIKIFNEKHIPYVIVFNKTDLIEINNYKKKKDALYVSAKNNLGINELKDRIGSLINNNKEEKFIIRDKLNRGDVVILVIPIDESAPKGRIILPQQNTLREILDAEAVAICCQPAELDSIIKRITPKLVITDSQAYQEVNKIVPDNIMLTSFSVLMARYKGNLKKLSESANKLSNLKDGDKILISEGCTHHRQCNDIGTVKFPDWIKNFTNKKIEFDFTQGGEFPADLTKYSLIIHCGGCMLNEAEMKSRMQHAKEQNIPIVNYGMAIAYMNGILERAMQIFKD